MSKLKVMLNGCLWNKWLKFKNYDRHLKSESHVAFDGAPVTSGRVYAKELVHIGTSPRHLSCWIVCILPETCPGSGIGRGQRSRTPNYTTVVLMQLKWAPVRRHARP